MDREIELLRRGMSDIRISSVAGMEFLEGSMGGTEVLVAKTGIGKVNAAILAGTAVLEYRASRIIFTGVAGAIDRFLDIADVVISSDLVQHDVDVTCLGYERGRIPGERGLRFTADPALVRAAWEAAVEVLGEGRVKIGTIATGDQFIGDRARCAEIGAMFGALAVEMEGGAVAQVASRFGIPFVVLRAISDRADGSAGMDYKEFMPIAAENSEKIVTRMLEFLR